MNAVTVMEHEPRGAGLVAGNAADAEVELAAVLRVRVLREGTGGGVGGALRGVMKSFKRRFVTEVIESFF